jgi:ParB-like chromosome segregation protein Spo0J
MAQANRIEQELDIQQVGIDDLQESPWSPNREDRETLDALKASIRQNGLVVPLVVREADNSIIGGHHRLYAIRELMGEGWELPGNTIPVVYVDVSEEQAKRLNLALNRITGEADPHKLGALLKELQALSANEELLATGYTSQEIDDLIELVETSPEDLLKSIPDHQPGDEQWVELSFRLPRSAAEIVREELDRIKTICSFTTQNADGLALEKMAVLSSLTPEESLQ